MSFRVSSASLVVVVLSCSLACEPPSPSEYPVFDCPDRLSFAPASGVGETVELQAGGPEEARYQWTLRDAPEGAEEMRPSPLGNGDERRTLLSMPVEGAYEVCFVADDADSTAGCCTVNAASELDVHELSPVEIAEISDVVTLGTTTSAGDGEVDGSLQLWVQLNQEADIDVSLTVPDGVVLPYQVSPQRYVGGGKGLVQLIAFFRLEEGAVGRAPADGDRIEWRVEINPLVVGSPTELVVPLELAPRTASATAPRIDDAVLVRNAADDGWRLDILDGENIADIVALDVGGWETRRRSAALDSNGSADLGALELTSGQHLAIRPWAYGNNRAHFGPPFTLTVP